MSLFSLIFFFNSRISLMVLVSTVILSLMSMVSFGISVTFVTVCNHKSSFSSNVKFLRLRGLRVCSGVELALSFCIGSAISDVFC